MFWISFWFHICFTGQLFRQESYSNKKEVFFLTSLLIFVVFVDTNSFTSTTIWYLKSTFGNTMYSYSHQPMSRGVGIGGIGGLHLDNRSFQCKVSRFLARKSCRLPQRKSPRSRCTIQKRWNDNTYTYVHLSCTGVLQARIYRMHHASPVSAHNMPKT